MTAEHSAADHSAADHSAADDSAADHSAVGQIDPETAAELIRNQSGTARERTVDRPVE